MSRNASGPCHLLVSTGWRTTKLTAMKNMQYSTYNNSVGKVYSYKYTPVGTECNGALSDAMAVTVRGKITDNRELVNGMQCKF